MVGPTAGIVERIPDLAWAADPVGNLFDAARSGRAAVRPDDLLALRVQLVNLQVVPGSPPRLRAQGNAASLILHLPPQSIAEEVFHEQAAAGTSEAGADIPEGKPAPSPPGDNNVDPPPIRARAAGESRLVFACPPDFECDYTLAGILQAVQALAMRVPASALPRQSAPVRPWFPWLVADVASTKGRTKGGAARTRPLAKASFSLRQAQIALRGGAAAEPTLLRRAGDFARQPALADMGPVRPPVLRLRPFPAPPAALETALELPWRLILSPHAGERWRHAAQPQASPATRRTELWHTRLLGDVPQEGTPAIEPPHADPARTLRAVWATTGPFGQPMSGAFPTGIGSLPLSTDGNPFVTSTTTLSDYDRYQISHLSANFSASNYTPEPVDAQLLMLSALGGWLDSRGDWEPPGLDLESWIHRATMGRDHYVRVVYRGVLFPFGHRAVLIKVSERKFHPHLPGNPAYLRQRFFMVVRERERRYDDAGTLTPYGADNQRVKNEFPFTRVRILTRVTPDLLPPETEDVAHLGQQLFWPMLDAVHPFRFRLCATDLDGRDCQFELPLVFMSNSLASPRYLSGGKLKPLYTGSRATGDGKVLKGAAEAANLAFSGDNGWDRPERRAWTVADLRRQRVTLAPSVKPGDTSVEVVAMGFGAHLPAPENTESVNAFKGYSQALTRPMFFPRVNGADAVVAPLSQLAGSTGQNRLSWNETYARRGFDGAQNKGEVFVDIASAPGMGTLDFSRQGDRSGGFVMPNLLPSALSRALGPTAGDVGEVLIGKVVPDQFFPPTPSLGTLPLPLLFGCIPLSAVIREVGDLLADQDKAPKFISEASSRIEAFFGEMMRLYQLVSALPQQPAGLARAALDVLAGTLADISSQASAFGAASELQVQNRVTAVIALVQEVRVDLDSLQNRTFDMADILAGIELDDLLDPPHGNGNLRAALEDLRDTVAAQAQVPAGFRQSVNGAVAAGLALVTGMSTILDLYGHGKALFDVLDDLLANDSPGQSLGELLTRPDELGPKLQAVADALGVVRDDIAGFPLLEGAPRDAILGTLDAVKLALDTIGGAAEALGNLLGEELVIRFDWKPEIKNWGFTDDAPLFVVHDPHAFVIAVEAKVKKSGGAPKIQVLCGLHHFDLVLIAPASFLELNFEKIEFKVDSSAKMGVDVVLGDIKFVGPLSFVETLRDLIPLDGFSDPPYLDISAQGIDAGFDVSLPSVTCGVLNISNLSLGAGFTVPFIGQPLSVRFNFCTREQPFHLTVWCFGGGGFFGITLDPSGIQLLEAAFEFGAAISVDFGVASGGVSVMAGIYFRMEKDACSLTGYFRLEGHVSVLGLITASLELYLELRYEFESGKCVGRAELTIEVEVLFFSGSVTISCEKKFAGSNGDPTLRQLMGLSTDPLLPLADELALIEDDTIYGWREYCDAFA